MYLQQVFYQLPVTKPVRVSVTRVLHYVSSKHEASTAFWFQVNLRCRTADRRTGLQHYCTDTSVRWPLDDAATILLSHQLVLRAMRRRAVCVCDFSDNSTLAQYEKLVRENRCIYIKPPLTKYHKMAW